MLRADELRAYLLEQRLDETSPSGGDPLPVSDHQLSRTGAILRQGKGLRVLIGYVVDTIAYAQVYKVILEGLAGVVPATPLAMTGLQLFGARQTNTYAPGQGVICAWRPGADECFILGAYPEAGADARLSLSDVIVAGANAGWKVDPYAQGAFLNPIEIDEGLTKAAPDWSSHRPLDGLTGGEQGAITETGTAFHLDSFIAYMRASEETGVFAFFQDELLRLTGRNLQLVSACAEREDADDQGMVFSEEGFADFAREAMGVADNEEEALRELTAEEAQLLTPWYYAREPAFDDQHALYRWRKWRGWLAGGEKALLQAIRNRLEGPQRLSEDAVLPGLFDSHVLQSGRFIQRSAKGWIIAKTPRVVSPKRRRPVHCDQKRDESPPALAAQLEAPVSTEAIGVHAAASVLDQLVYSANYEGLKGFLELPSSWYVPEESELDYAEPALAPLFAGLAENQYLPVPDPFTIDLDERYGDAGTAKYWPNNAFISALDDGGIVIQDAWGSEIRMTQGHIFFQAAGDIWAQAARNVNLWAGHDLIAKANKSMDLTASHRDVRVKAQRNIMILGGNETCGGVLIESRGPAPAWRFEERVGEDAVVGGIVLLARASQIVQTAQDVVFSADCYTFTPAVRSPDDAEALSDLVIDLGEGKTIWRGRGFDRRFIGPAACAVDAFALNAAGDTFRANEYALDRTNFHSNVYIDQGLLVQDCVAAGGSIFSLDGTVGPPGEEARVELEAALDGQSARLEEVAEFLASSLEEGWSGYVDRASGDVSQAEFSLRTVEQYATTDFLIYEARWQQQARLAGQEMPTWSEPIVDTAIAGPTRPYPGQGVWDTALSGRTVDNQLYDEEAGMAADREDAAYLESETAEPETYELEGGYTVVIDVTA
ncbi:MAG: hypothetical protein E6G97_17915 [Alphaproteobacteria bacterium]|nr:MAG: hypothetical protein E6G97_17915 [Alphaproteobacteria bacterium]